MASQAKSLLGVDINLINADDARSRIVKACVKCWFEKNGSHLYNMSDCSGFVKAVQQELRLRPFDGDANSIFKEVDPRGDWLVLGSGSDALMAAGRAADQGSFTIGIWKNPEVGKRGHVAIILSYLSLLGSKPEHHSIAAWGQYGKVGDLFGQMSKSFGKDKHSQIRYAKCLTPVL